MLQTGIPGYRYCLVNPDTPEPVREQSPPLRHVNRQVAVRNAPAFVMLAIV